VSFYSKCSRALTFENARKVVPETCRSMLYNLFRVPLNALVVLALLTDIPVRIGFAMTTAMLLVCVWLLRRPVYGIAQARKAQGVRDEWGVDVEGLGKQALECGRDGGECYSMYTEALLVTTRS